MAFFIFLPMIILAPAKFAMTFSIGSGEQGRLLGLACHFCERLAAVFAQGNEAKPSPSARVSGRMELPGHVSVSAPCCCSCAKR